MTHPYGSTSRVTTFGMRPSPEAYLPIAAESHPERLLSEVADASLCSVSRIFSLNVDTGQELRSTAIRTGTPSRELGIRFSSGTVCGSISSDTMTTIPGPISDPSSSQKSPTDEPR